MLGSLGQSKRGTITTLSLAAATLLFVWQLNNPVRLERNPARIHSSKYMQTQSNPVQIQGPAEVPQEYFKMPSSVTTIELCYENSIVRLPLPYIAERGAEWINWQEECPFYGDYGKPRKDKAIGIDLSSVLHSHKEASSALENSSMIALSNTANGFVHFVKPDEFEASKYMLLDKTGGNTIYKYLGDSMRGQDHPWFNKINFLTQDQWNAINDYCTVMPDNSYILNMFQQ